MNVRADGSADRKPVGARLLLPDTPCARHVVLRNDVVADQIRPSNSRLNAKKSAIQIEPEHSIHPSHVEHPAVGRELLSAHRMKRPARHQVFAAFADRLYGGHDFLDAHRHEPAANGRSIQMRVRVVEEEGRRWSKTSSCLTDHRSTAVLQSCD